MARRILFVDDEVNILRALRRLLERDYEIDTAAGARMGLEALAASGPYAVIVSDLRMPEMDGRQFIAEVRRLSPETVTLILSGHVNFESVAADDNVFRVLTKPCPPDILRGALDAALMQYERVTAERNAKGFSCPSSTTPREAKRSGTNRQHDRRT